MARCNSLPLQRSPFAAHNTHAGTAVALAGVFAYGQVKRASVKASSKAQ